MIVPLVAAADLERACAEPVAVIYKHSPRCGVCIAAEREVKFFVDGHAETPVFWLDVVTDRALAERVASRLSVPHESPQVILLSAGRPSWVASHWDVRALDLEEQLARVPTA